MNTHSRVARIPATIIKSKVRTEIFTCLYSPRSFFCSGKSPGRRGSLDAILLPNQVLAHIDGAGNQDNQTLDDVQGVLIHRQEVQTGEDDLQQQNTYHNTGYLTDTTNEGDTADDAGSNGVTLVVQTGVGVDGGDEAIQRAG